MPLGNLLGPLEALSGGLESEKMQTVLHENQFFEIALFRFLKLLIGFLGSSWPLLGPIWSQNAPQNGPQKWSKKWTKKWSRIQTRIGWFKIQTRIQTRIAWERARAPNLRSGTLEN